VPSSGLSSVRLVAIRPIPKKIVATRPVYCTPKDLITLIDDIPKATMDAMYKLRTKVMVRTFESKASEYRTAVCRSPYAVV
jgi:hypothetical protein